MVASAWCFQAGAQFFGISTGVAATLTGGLIITSEATFYLGIALLGREMWGKIKTFSLERKQRWTILILIRSLPH
jgi:hypothetical protein